MNETERAQTHPTSDEVLDLQHDLRRCALCPHLFPKDDMTRLELDLPGNWCWICPTCDEGLEQGV